MTASEILTSKDPGIRAAVLTLVDRAQGDDVLGRDLREAVARVEAHEGLRLLGRILAVAVRVRGVALLRECDLGFSVRREPTFCRRFGRRVRALGGSYDTRLSKFLRFRRVRLPNNEQSLNLIDEITEALGCDVIRFEPIEPTSLTGDVHGFLYQNHIVFFRGKASDQMSGRLQEVPDHV